MLSANLQTDPNAPVKYSDAIARVSQFGLSDREKSALSGFLYMLQRNTEGRLVSPIEPLDKVKSEFSLRQKDLDFAIAAVNRLGVGEIERRVTEFKLNRERHRAEGIKKRGDERRAQELSFQNAALQARADAGDVDAQRQIDIGFQPRLGSAGLGPKSSAQVGEEGIARGAEKVFDPKGFQQDAPAAALRFLVSAPFAALIKNEQTNRWLERTKREYESGKFKNAEALGQFAQDTILATGNQVGVFADLGGLGTGAFKAVEKPIEAASRAARTLTSVAKSLEKAGAPKAVVDDIVQAMTKATKVDDLGRPLADVDNPVSQFIKGAEQESTASKTAQALSEPGATPGGSTRLSDILGGASESLDAKLAEIAGRRTKSTLPIRSKQAGAFNASVFEDVADAIEYGAVWFAKGVTDFAQWSAKMVEQFGDEVRPHLKRLYDSVTGKTDDVGQAARDFMGGPPKPPSKDIPALPNPDDAFDRGFGGKGRENPFFDRIQKWFPAGTVKGALGKLGPVGNEVMQDIRNILGLAEKGLQDDAITLKKAFERVFTNRAARKDAIANLAKKAVSGERLNALEQKVWDQWVSINGSLIERASELGVLVNRFVSGDVGEKLVGRRIRFTRNFQLAEGKVTRVGEDALGRKGVFVDFDGEEVFLRNGTRIQSDALVDADSFFPRVLKSNIAERILKHGSKERDAAVKHLVDTGQAIDRADAENLLKASLDPVGTIESDVRGSRLRMPRDQVLLPESFYEWDFAKVADAHIRDAQMDLARAQVWGADERVYLEKLNKAGLEKSEINRLKDFVFNGKTYSKAAEALSKNVRALEVVTKLTPFTAIKQLSQVVPAVQRYGIKNVLSGAAEYIKNPRRVTEEIQRLGGGSQSTLDFLARISANDESALARAATFNVNVSGIKALDSLSRVVSAKAALIDATKALENFDKAGKKGWGWRQLTDYIGFSDVDVARIRKSGFTNDDLARIVRTSEEAQGLTDRLSLPEVFDGPLAKLMFQFQSFNAAMGANIGHALKEASRGNLTPALRGGLAAVVAGEGIGDAIAGIENMVGIENDRIDGLKDAVSALIESGEIGPLSARAMENFAVSGTLGLWEIPMSVYRSQTEGGLPPEKQLTSAGVSTGLNIIGAMAHTAKSEDGFLKAVTDAGAKLSKDEIVLLKKFYKRYKEPKKSDIQKDIEKSVPDIGKQIKGDINKALSGIP